MAQKRFGHQPGRPLLSRIPDGVPVPQIAAELGVHRQIIYRIIRRK